MIIDAKEYLQTIRVGSDLSELVQICIEFDLKNQSHSNRNNLDYIFRCLVSFLGMSDERIPSFINFFHGIWWVHSLSSLKSNELGLDQTHIVIHNQIYGPSISESFHGSVVTLPHPVILFYATFGRRGSDITVVCAPHYRFRQGFGELVIDLYKLLENDTIAASTVVLLHPDDEIYIDQLDRVFDNRFLFIRRSNCGGAYKIVIQLISYVHANRVFYFEPSSACLFALMMNVPTNRVFADISRDAPAGFDYSSVVPTPHPFREVTEAMLTGKSYPCGSLFGESLCEFSVIERGLEEINCLRQSRARSSLVALRRNFLGVRRAVGRRMSGLSGSQPTQDVVELSYRLKGN